MVEEQTSSQKKRINKLKAKLMSVPEGKELLELAEENSCLIVFDKTLKPNQFGWMDFNDRALKLNPDTDDSILLNTISHELRHLWQACTLDFSSIYNSALYGDAHSSIVFMRVTEGDANAFAAKLVAKIENQAENIDMSKLFIDFQKTASAQIYDKQTISYLKNIKESLESGKFSPQGIKAIFNAASMPDTPDKDLLKITLKGLSKKSTSYMGYTDIEELSSSIISYVPQETLDKALSLKGNIRKNAQKMLKNSL